MSGWGPTLARLITPKSPRTLGNAREARCVHRPSIALLLSSLCLGSALAVGTVGTGCVIPPPLSLDEPDAGENHPPVIRVVRDGAGLELARPGPLTFQVGSGELRITAVDTDLGDALFVRMYVDYGLADVTPFRVQCEAAPGAAPTSERTITCPLLGLCTDGLIDGTEHVFELDLLDRLPITTAARPFRDVTVPGEIATFWWRLNCVARS